MSSAKWYVVECLMHLFKSFIYRVIKKTYPPSRAEMKNPPGKLSIAFSNTTYLDIIWKISWRVSKFKTCFFGLSKKAHFWHFFAPKHTNGLKNRMNRGIRIKITLIIYGICITSCITKTITTKTIPWSPISFCIINPISIELFGANWYSGVQRTHPKDPLP